MHEFRNVLISEILFAVNLTGNSNECKFIATILILVLVLHGVLEIRKTHHLPPSGAAALVLATRHHMMAT
jgi:hypothetical protein